MKSFRKRRPRDLVQSRRGPPPGRSSARSPATPPPPAALCGPAKTTRSTWCAATMAAKPCTIPKRYVAPSSIGPTPSIGGGGRLAVANRQAGGLDNVGERRIPHPERHLSPARSPGTTTSASQRSSRNAASRASSTPSMLMATRADNRTARWITIVLRQSQSHTPASPSSSS